MRIKTPVRIGASSPGSNLYDFPAILKEALGLPIRIASGYKGFADIRLAVEGGEVDGTSVPWTGIRPFWGDKVGDFVPIVQTALSKRLPDLPDVPTALEVAKTEEARELIQHGIIGVSQLLMVYALRPGTPKDRVEALRKAFETTLKDPEYLEDAKKSKVVINRLSGDEVETIIGSLWKGSPSVRTKLREVLAAKKG
jgi:tripartite-type tricarboxylate transporter receptor subunit TctC